MPVHLDNISAMASMDPSGMLDQMISLPTQLKESLSYDLRFEEEPHKVCMCGLGGSAMGADILNDHLERSSTVVSAVARDVSVPKWVDEDTLVLLISYSGNTRETLAMCEQARRRNARIVAITSGGTLMRSCQECGETLVQVPGGYQPRAALGYLLGASASVLEAASVAPVATELGEILPSIEEQVTACSPSTTANRNLAKQVAKDLDGKMPFIYSSKNVRAAAKRWQTQINENSKMLCLSGELPEADHNQIVGWIDGLRDGRNAPVFLKAEADDGMMADIVRATLSIFEDFKLDPVVVDLKGRSPLENVMRGVVIGDFVSYYLAMLKGVDPLPVSSISELKKRLG